MIVDLVHVKTRDGIRLDSTWRKPYPEKASPLGVDAVIFHHGVGGNFYNGGPGTRRDRRAHRLRAL